MLKINKRKATMVLYQLEESLGSYVIKQKPEIDTLPNKTVDNILDRNNRIIDKNNLKELIGATYLDELFNFALEATYNTSMHQHIKALRELFVTYDIYAIRNIIAHPNRLFRDEHWYKIATVASNSLIEIIGLEDVKKALISAEKGKIEDPPEEWLQEISEDIIKNNLPKKLEHSITGLVGRKAEEKELLKLLENPRIPTIGIVASGGIGKTALVLDLLNSMILREETLDWCEGIVFLDMKLEKLTQYGIEKLKAIETIEEVKNSLKIEINRIFNDSLFTLEELFKKYENKKLLIFIDNLETLIRDYHESFEEFNLSLPREWRLLVTSRISISSASIISLKNLNENSAIHLAKTYISKSGQDALFEDEYKKVAEQCHFNPLAIRLTLDLYISGNGLPTSINKSTKMIADFSFQNLIDKLSENSIKILEALFVESNLNRSRLGILLGLSLDDIYQGIHELSKTSLIARNSINDIEVFNLSSSIRELLLSSPKNIEMRSSIQEQINSVKIHSQEIDRAQDKDGVNELNIKFIPKNIDPNLKIMVNKLNQSFNGYKIDANIASELFREFNNGQEIYCNEYIFHRSLGRLYVGLKDYNGALKSYEKALEIKSNDYVTMELMAKIYFFTFKEYAIAEQIYSKMLSDKNNSDEICLNDSKKFLIRIISSYFFSLLYQHKYEIVLEKTKDWQNNNVEVKGILGTYRASAWRRKIESITLEEYTQRAEAIDNSIDIFNIVFNEVGYIDLACKQVIKLIEEIEHTMNYKTIYTHRTDWFEFIDCHLINISNSLSKIDNEYLNNLIQKLAKIKTDQNIFKTQKWKEFTAYIFTDAISEEDAKSLGYTVINITHIPELDYEFPNYLFGEDIKGHKYCIHLSSLLRGGFDDWKHLEKNMKLAIMPEKSKNVDQSDTSGETRFVN